MNILLQPKCYINGNKKKLLFFINISADKIVKADKKVALKTEIIFKTCN